MTSLLRKNIGIFGRMNVGKSTLLNLITQQQTSLVDSKPGTTADVCSSVMEFHKIGPVKLLDTAGIDEKHALGEKKHKKTITAIKESDLVLLVIDPYKRSSDLSSEKDIIDTATKRKKNILIIYNIFRNKQKDSNHNSKETNALVGKIQGQLDIKFEIKKIVSDFSIESGNNIVSFLEKNVIFQENTLEMLPPSIIKESIVFLNIPMDKETPEGRLLRPQARLQEYLIRKFISVFAYRMNLTKARSHNTNVREEERQRFLKNIRLLQKQDGLSLLVTDSQAIDIIHPWTLDENNNSIVPITTFSIIMINEMSNGNLKEFARGVHALEHLKKGDKILIAEACNHNRIAEDIGTVQIPRKIEECYGKSVITIDHAFGREIEDKNFDNYKLIIHCGGCMLNKQKLKARLQDIIESGIPVTNYGIVLAFFQSPQALKRVLEPWKVGF